MRRNRFPNPRQRHCLWHIQVPGKEKNSLAPPGPFPRPPVPPHPKPSETPPYHPTSHPPWPRSPGHKVHWWLAKTRMERTGRKESSRRRTVIYSSLNTVLPSSIKASVNWRASVLECACPLALFPRYGSGRPTERQRAAALQNASRHSAKLCSVMERSCAGFWSVAILPYECQFNQPPSFS